MPTPPATARWPTALAIYASAALGQHHGAARRRHPASAALRRVGRPKFDLQEQLRRLTPDASHSYGPDTDPPTRHDQSHPKWPRLAHVMQYCARESFEMIRSPACRATRSDGTLIVARPCSEPLRLTSPPEPFLQAGGRLEGRRPHSTARGVIFVPSGMHPHPNAHCRHLEHPRSQALGEVRAPRQRKRPQTTRSNFSQLGRQAGARSSKRELRAMRCGRSGSESRPRIALAVFRHQAPLQ